MCSASAQICSPCSCSTVSASAFLQCLALADVAVHSIPVPPSSRVQQSWSVGKANEIVVGALSCLGFQCCTKRIRLWWIVLICFRLYYFVYVSVGGFVFVFLRSSDCFRLCLLHCSTGYLFLFLVSGSSLLFHVVQVLLSCSGWSWRVFWLLWCSSSCSSCVTLSRSLTLFLSFVFFSWRLFFFVVLHGFGLFHDVSGLF